MSIVTFLLQSIPLSLGVIYAVNSLLYRLGQLGLSAMSWPEALLQSASSINPLILTNVPGFFIQNIKSYGMMGLVISAVVLILIGGLFWLGIHFRGEWHSYISVTVAMFVLYACGHIMNFAT